MNIEKTYGGKFKDKGQIVYLCSRERERGTCMIKMF